MQTRFMMTALRTAKNGILFHVLSQWKEIEPIQSNILFLHSKHHSASLRSIY